MIVRVLLPVVAVSVAVAAAGCAKQASAQPTATSPSTASGYAAPSKTQLQEALLTNFGDAKPYVAEMHGADSIVLVPVSGNKAAAQEAGLTQLPIATSVCAPWLSGPLVLAMKAGALGPTGEAALTTIYGSYPKPSKTAQSPASVALIRGSEVIVAAPSQAAAAKLIPGPVPATCQHTRVATQQLPTLPVQWNPGQVKSLDVAPLGAQVQAESIIQHGANYLPPTWAETFRLRNYDIGIVIETWPGISKPLTVLQQLADAAEVKVSATLPGLASN